MVNTNADGDDGTCNGANCTLREAIGAANDNIGPNTIVFAANVTGAIVLTGGELAISDDVTIVGPGAATLTVSGNDASLVFNITSGTVDISGLTIANGNNADLGGGGISVGPGVTLTTSNLVLHHNTAYEGGAIWNDGGTVTISGGAIYSNTAIYQAARSRTMAQSAWRACRAAHAWASMATTRDPAAAISNSGPLVLTNADIYTNQAEGDGGAIWTSRSVTISNTAIYSNTVAGSGGALHILG